ncbi:MAG: hypothetical protein B6244_05880 [Candidatus Cloacimonetes bacterium 4572_55]|nr:MAG: hypothetical protein B6244_05880 [Candidatus Cloacimonetes bacterium 4572_55]
MNPTLSICVVNYNAGDVVVECLESIYKNVTIPDLEVILVDNASSDQSNLTIKKKFPQTILIQNSENAGFIRANNQGLKRSRGRYVLSLNPDTIVPPGSLEKLTHFLETHPDYGAVGGKLHSPNNDFQWQCRRSFPTPFVACAYFLRLRKFFPEVELFHRYTLTNYSPDQSLDVEAISGACFMVPREVLEQTNGMDESFFMYGDDLDWSYRIHEKGWKIRYCADAPIMHYGGLGGAQHGSYRLISHYYNAMWIFYDHHLRRSRSLPTTLLVWIGIKAMTGLHKLLFALGIRRSVSRKK